MNRNCKAANGAGASYWRTGPDYIEGSDAPGNHMGSLSAKKADETGASDRERSVSLSDAVYLALAAYSL